MTQETRNAIEQVKFLNQILETMMWKGKKDHPQKIMFHTALSHLIQEIERQDEPVGELPKRREAKYIDSPEAIQFNSESFLKTEGFNSCLDLVIPIVKKKNERIKELQNSLADANSRAYFFDHLVERACIGTKEIPSLKAYVEKIESELNALKPVPWCGI